MSLAVSKYKKGALTLFNTTDTATALDFTSVLTRKGPFRCDHTSTNAPDPIRTPQLIASTLPSWEIKIPFDPVRGCSSTYIIRLLRSLRLSKFAL
ncbi:hypothetical protein MTR_5g011110 [Medicago truncatula]|uniref:Uncharacterized protein n=1 Tax=Medicago truncatula TaxID=3880 RepID=G7KES7_MEDTR|nr:hypothetical protein MTR_5g011110 [Medicago truncatula]